MLLPLLWRYLFFQYAKTLLLSLAGFLLILLSTRLEDAAKLLSLGTSFSSVCLYILYQIPYVLQIALPISTLIGALYLFQRLSANSELTAARASGISLFELLAPLMIFSIFIAVCSFEIFFDLSAQAHLEGKKLEYSVRSTQPLAMLANSSMLEKKGIKLDMRGSLISDKYAEDMILAMNTGSLSLILAKKVASDKGILHGEDTTLITTRPNGLIIENTKENATSLAEVSLVANKNRMWKAQNDLLSLPLLLAKRSELEQKAEAKLASEKSPKSKLRKIRRIDAEIVRRFSLALSIVTFTLLGIAYGSTVGRMNKTKRLLWVASLTGLFLISYLAAKGMDKKPITAILLYTIPHIVISLASFRRLLLIQRGAEV